ncbi:MAG: phosphatase PAP2 family protein [Abitibacteriaceae bacterium]|nr:phosphatase PAP2 family protein [Abditibacteriaceae bacterium]MBV9865811.1 phosphatase PAP2 family protein [Abditibacteriaceae bacterium]
MNTLIIFGAKYLFAIILLGAAALAWRIPREQRTLYFCLAALAGVLATILTKSAGALYFDPRPFTHGVVPLIPHAADNGFPSDHTVLSVTTALLCYGVNKKVGAGLLGLAVLVGTSRVLVGINSPLDVVAGAVIGTVAVAATLTARHPLENYLNLHSPTRSGEPHRPPTAA